MYIFKFLKSIFFPVGIVLGLKSTMMPKAKDEVAIPLDEIFLAFHEDEVKIDGSLPIDKAMEMISKSKIGSDPYREDLVKASLWKMQAVIELIVPLREFDAVSGRMDHLTPEKRRYFFESVDESCFRIATSPIIPLEEKLKFFFAMQDAYPEFTKVFSFASSICHDYQVMKPIFVTASEKVNEAFLLVLRMSMDSYDKKSASQFHNMLHDAFDQFTENDFTEFEMLGLYFLENQNYSAEEKKKIMAHLMSGYKSQLVKH